MKDGTALANGSGDHKRRELDFYPTPPNVTHALMQFLQLAPTVVWEPACGDGAMSNVLAQYGHTVLSTDLRESGFGIGGVDFLQDSGMCDLYAGCGAIITNPPFNVSGEFITTALRRAPIVAMLLKSQYWHAAKRAKLFEAHRPAYVLPLTWRPDFMNGERGGSPTMEVAWTVWIDGQHGAEYRPLSRPAEVQNV